MRLLSAGYPTRVSFEQLERQFKPLAPAKFQRLPPAMFSAALLIGMTLGPLCRWWTKHQEACPLDHVLASYTAGLFPLAVVVFGLRWGFKGSRRRHGSEYPRRSRGVDAARLRS